MSEMVHITINKQPLEVPAGTRIIEAAKMLNIDIPHLCYHPDQTIKAHCRMCMVEVVGSRKLTAACSTVVWEGMEVITDSKKVYDAQTGVLDLILSDHKTNCLSCARNGSCELQALCRRFNRLHPELPDISSDEPLRIERIQLRRHAVEPRDDVLDARGVPPHTDKGQRRARRHNDEQQHAYDRRHLLPVQTFSFQFLHRKPSLFIPRRRDRDT